MCLSQADKSLCHEKSLCHDWLVTQKKKPGTFPYQDLLMPLEAAKNEKKQTKPTLFKCQWKKEIKLEQEDTKY